ncbi:MAG: T9SS type A sorting domain-containing protein [Candidatus Marinimicrobia bacterium]|nr:T9SS type A sorting domain-containing protein [Candidatus Neomarinimicrobiota bacterium]
MKIVKLTLLISFVVLTFSGGLFAQESATLLGHWAFDGSLVDSAGSVDGTFKTATGDGSLKFTEGRFGQALDLDYNSKEYVVLGDSTDLNLGENDFSVSVWVKTTGWMDDAPIIANKDWDSGNNTGWLIAGEGGGEGSWQWNYNTSESDDDIDYDPDGPILSDDKWHNITVTVDRDGDAKYYFDGILQSLDDVSDRLGSVDPGYPTVVGTDGAEGEFWPEWFGGAIDEVRIYLGVLTEKEVADLAELELIPELVGHWSFDYTLEDAVDDAHGTFSGYELTYTEDLFGGGALSLDGYSDHVILGDSLDFRFGDEVDFSVALWVRSDGWNDDAAIISNKDWDSGNNVGWLIAGEGGGEGSWQWNYNTVGSDDDLDYDPDGPMLSDGKWHHLAVTHDRDSVAIFYFDGVPQDTMDISTRSGSLNSGYPVVVGTDGAQGVNYPYWFKGDIDDIRMYNYVIEKEQIEKLAEKPVMPKPVGHWTFDNTMEDMVGDADGVYYDQNGQEASPKFVEGRFGNAVDLDMNFAYSHWIKLGDTEDLNFGYKSDFTVSIWVKTSRWKGDAPIISNKDWGSGNNTGWLIAGEGGGEGSWQWNYNTSESDDDEDFDPDEPIISDDEWHHICVTHDRDSIATMYADGEIIGYEDIGHLEGSIDAGLNTVIGNDGTGSYGDYFDGLIDEVRIYNYALDYEQVINLAENPEIISIKDVPDDQGGWVFISFHSAILDDGNHSDIKYYMQRKDGDVWTSFGSAPATGDSIYQVMVKTLADSTEESDNIAEFRLVTTSNDGVWYSQPVEGYSVDNIKPSVPQNLMASAGDEGVNLSWNPSPDPDFEYYAIYKSKTSPDFDPSGQEPAYKTSETELVDSDLISGDTYYYRVTAFDDAGNESEYSESVSFNTTSLKNENALPDDFALHQNYPNPFNPVTTIEFDLPVQSFVTITVYNLQGKTVTQLVKENKEAGFHTVRWNASDVASGTYFYQIKTKEYTSLKKMILIK